MNCEIRLPDPLESWNRTSEVMWRTLRSMERWRERESERLRRKYPQPSPAQRLAEEVIQKSRGRKIAALGEVDAYRATLAANHYGSAEGKLSD